VTDANLLLGRLPLATPLAGEVSLDGGAAERAVGRLADELGLAQLDCAEGIVRVAEAEMLGALRVMSIERGIDPRACALMPFGGAGPLHAAALAQELGIDRVLCPRASGVLSALGLAAAPPRRDVARSVLLRGDQLSSEAVRRARTELLAQAEADLRVLPERVRVGYELRYRGQSFELRVEEELADAGAAGLEPTELRAAFAREHERRYGYSDPAAEVELVTMRVSVWGSAPQLRIAGPDRPQPHVQAGHVRFAGEWLPTSILHGEPARGTTLEGPALCALGDSTLFVPPGWRGRVDAYGTIHVRSAGAA
jgi:N-methylhydantoinase A